MMIPSSKKGRMTAVDAGKDAEAPSLCYFGTYESAYPRNRMLIKALRQSGWTVTECHVPLWEQQEHKGASFGLSPGFALQVLTAQVKLLVKYLSQPRHDVVMVGYIGHLDMFLAWILTRFSRTKLVFNPLVSMFDTVVGDRGFASSESLKGRLFRWIDRVACRLSDLVLLDTDAHIEYFRDVLGLGSVPFRKLWVGADDEVFFPNDTEGENGEFNVVFIGKFIPLHGLHKILEMAKWVEDEERIRFTIVGTGQLHDEIHAQRDRLALSNSEFIDWIEYNALGELMSKADLVLGIFGDSDKSRRVIPNKLYQALAVGKAVLTADTPAVRELLTDGVDVFLSEAEPEAMATRLKQIFADRGKVKLVAQKGYKRFKDSADLSSLGRSLDGQLRELIYG